MLEILVIFLLGQVLVCNTKKVTANQTHLQTGMNKFWQNMSTEIFGIW